MLFFFKPKKIVVDAFTPIHVVHKYFSIKPAVQHIPEWWKNTPKTLNLPVSSKIRLDTPTIKTCPGFIDFYKKGFIVPSWTDMIFVPDKNMPTNIDSSFASSEVSLLFNKGIVSHNSSQWNNSFDDAIHFKLLSPWTLHQKEDISWLIAEPTWNTLKDNINLRLVPGSMNFKLVHSLNFNYFITNKMPLIEIEADQPLAHLIPITEKDVELRNHLVSKEEWDRLRFEDTPTFKFNNTYKFIEKWHKTNIEKKCPFH